MKTYGNIVDREGWPRGLWDDEPDRAEWVHDESGTTCTMRRGPLGSWCGYCGVRENHRAYNVHYDKIDADVHGGLTYGSACKPLGEDQWINYRVYYDCCKLEALVYPYGDSARHLREDKQTGHDTRTFEGFLAWQGLRVLCHPGCRHGIWWLGFDCAQYNDLIPGMMRHMSSMGERGETYKTFDYVVEETNNLAVALLSENILTNPGG